ncbi:hypothetical protein ES703_121478 [subsurface metagenome]
MKDLINMWNKTRLIVLVAVTAAVYAALMLPFKLVTIIPGYTELRPGVAIPTVFSILFGPAAPWGAAFGNIVGDYLGGMLGWGSLFGLLGNFFLGYIPYRVAKPLVHRIKPGLWGTVQIILACALASIVCGVIIGWGLDLLGILPFATLGNIIIINNLLFTCILTPIFYRLLVFRSRRWNLHYTQVLGEDAGRRSRTFGIGIILLTIGAIGGWVAGNLLSLQIIEGSDLIALLQQASGGGYLIEGASGSLTVSWGLSPAILMIIAGAILI